MKTAIRPVLLGLVALTLGSVAPSAPAQAQGGAAVPDTVLLWPEGAPDAVGEEPEDRPTLTIYRPPLGRATGAGMVICPGGGYAMLAMEKEGHKFARWLNAMGIAAFVLKYRLGGRYDHPAPIRDAQRALRYVRSREGALGVDADRLGLMGFSAGGHLAAATATLFDHDFGVPQDALLEQSARPDLLVLGYPVIAFGEEDYTHTGSRRQILGGDYDPETARLLSPDKQVTSETPPAFIFSTDEDEGVPAENSVAFYLAMRKAGVPAELHVYERGPHGVGMAAEDVVLSSWTDRLADWLQIHGWRSRAPAEAGGSATSEAGPQR